MTELHIRPAVRSDGEGLRDLDQSTWSPLHAVTPRLMPPFDPFFNSSNRPEDILIAEMGGAGDKIAGYISVQRATSLASNAHVRQIQGLCVQE